MFKLHNLKCSYISYSLLFLILILITGCGNIDVSAKKSCESSGGEYIEAVAETSGVYYYCSCPNGNYETTEHICVIISEEDITKCNSLSSEGVSCDNNGAECECLWEQGHSNKIPYSRLTSNDCNCQCVDGYCNCFCNLK